VSADVKVGGMTGDEMAEQGPEYYAATPGDLVNVMEKVVALLRERGQRLEVIDMRNGWLHYRAVPARRAI
jgi:hypothetical protein